MSWHGRNFFLPGTEILSEGKYILRFDFQNDEINARKVVEKEINILPAGTIGANVLMFALLDCNIGVPENIENTRTLQHPPIFTLGSIYAPALIFRLSEIDNTNDDFILTVSQKTQEGKVIDITELPIPEKNKPGGYVVLVSTPGKFKIQIDGLDKKSGKKFHYELPYMVIDEVWELSDLCREREQQAPQQNEQSLEPKTILTSSKGQFTMVEADRFFPNAWFSVVLDVHDLPADSNFFTPRVSISFLGNNFQYDDCKEEVFRTKPICAVSPDSQTSFCRIPICLTLPDTDILPSGKYSLNVEVEHVESGTKRVVSKAIEIFPKDKAPLDILNAYFHLVKPDNMRKNEKDVKFLRPPVFVSKGYNMAMFQFSIFTNSLRMDNVVVHCDQLDMEGNIVSHEMSLYSERFPPNRISARMEVMTAIPGKYKMRVVAEDRTSGQKLVSDFPLIVLDAEKELSSIQK